MKILLIIFIFLTLPLYADQEATTKDGKKVLLMDDGTWSYKKEDDDTKLKAVYAAGEKRRLKEIEEIRAEIKKTKDKDKKRVLNKKLSAVKKLRNKYVPYINWKQPGSFGKINHPIVIEQIIDKNNALVSIFYVTAEYMSSGGRAVKTRNAKTAKVWLKGVDTSTWTNDTGQSMNYIFKHNGNKQYNSVGGVIQTAKLFEVYLTSAK